MRQYSFVTHWHFAAPLSRVWDAIVDVESWPRWWKYVRSVVPLEKGGEDGVGAAHRYIWTGRLPYKLTFNSRVTEVRTHSVLQAEALGDLSGTGRWSFEEDEDGSGTRVRYDWNVSTSKKWMNHLAPFLEPVFRWNHDEIMKEGGRALARHLGAELTVL